jgi:Transposase domain (DUF772)
MSLPQFDVQGSLFESLGAIAPELFGDHDKYKLFAKKVWPVLAQSREQLAECYQADNGRPGVEPVVLLGVLIFQFLERVPDRQAVELVKYHLGWKLALNLKLSEGGFHPTTLVYFRQRLIEHAKADVAMRAVLAALQKEGLICQRLQTKIGLDPCFECGQGFERFGMCTRDAALGLGRTGARLSRVRAA